MIPDGRAWRRALSIQLFAHLAYYPISGFYVFLLHRSREAMRRAGQGLDADRVAAATHWALPVTILLPLVTAVGLLALYRRSAPGDALAQAAPENRAATLATARKRLQSGLSSIVSLAELNAIAGLVFFLWGAPVAWCTYLLVTGLALSLLALIRAQQDIERLTEE